jgi:hypothetical protein
MPAAKWQMPEIIMKMQKWKKWTKFAIPIAVVTAFVAWYAFRPERLVVNRRVDEAMPNIQGGSSSQPLVAG